MRRLRAPLAIVCGVSCVAGLVFGLVFAYTARTFFDPSRFSDRVAASLAEPAVAGIVADQITDQILESYRDLTPYRPMVRGAVEYVVASTPFRAVVRRAAKKGHATLISQAGENLALTVSDLGVVLRNALSMYPQIAEKVPERAQVVLGAITERPMGKNLMRVIQIGQRLRMRAAIWLGVGFALGACGFFLAHRKDRYLLRVGLGITLTALIVGSVARFGGPVFALLPGSHTASELIRGLWPAFIGPLALRMLVLAGIGLVVVAGVTSLLQKINLAALARSAWSRVDESPQRTRFGLLRALGFIVVGMLVAFNPFVALQCAAIVAGATLFFIGVQELFSNAMRILERMQLKRGVTKDAKGFSMSNAAVVAGLVLLVVSIGVVWLVQSDDATAIASTRLDACNLHPELCDRRLNDVAFAATHNSMAAADITDWMFPNQEKGIRGQLEDGIRGFLIDVHYGVPVGDRIRTELEDEKASMEKYTEALGAEGVAAAMRIRGRLVGEPTGERDLYLGHGFCELGAQRLEDVLGDMHNFLVENPNEVVIIIVQDEGIVPADFAACVAKSGLEDFVYRGSVTPPWATLRELIASDQRVLMFAENRVDSVPWYHLAVDVFQETPYRFLDLSEFSNKPNRGGTKGSLLLMNHWIETTPAPKPSNAEIVNAYDFLLKRAQACRRERKMMPTLIAVDFYHTGDLLRVVDTMNGIKEPVIAPVP